VTAAKHPQEETRLATLARYEILDTEAEAEFDEVVRVVSAICNVPVSLISLVDSNRQWFKAKAGTDISETPIEASVCAHGILQPDLLEIPDLTKDFRTIDNPIVKGDPHVRFYAGAALMAENGMPLGMLCVLDFEPRQLTESQRDLLQVMAKLVMRQMELRRLLKVEHQQHLLVQEVLTKANALLERNDTLRKEIDHRVKNSLHQVAAFLRIQERGFKDQPAVAGPLAEARNRVMTVASVHDHLQRSVEDDHASVAQFLSDLCAAISHNRPPNLAPLVVEADMTHLPSDKIMALGLVVNEMTANAMKHAFPDGKDGVIKVAFHSDTGIATLRVSDNGAGLADDFNPAASKGLGLKVINGLVQQLGGTLNHHSTADGASFTLRFPLASAPAN
jgi:two-component sensor histidine kinase